MKRYILFALFQFACIAAIAAEEPENPLELWATGYQRISKGHPPVCVTAYLKQTGNNYLLAFKLTNISTNSLTLFQDRLPWGNAHSIRLVAVDTDGHCVPSGYAIDDVFARKEITIAPGESREGDYRLADGVRLSLAPKDKDIVVLWFYQVPDDFTICSGAVVVPNKAAKHVLTESQAVELAKQECRKSGMPLDQFSWTARKSGEKRWMVVFRLKEPGPFWNSVYVFVDEETGQIVLRGDE
jgi:hypothetical protein